MPRKKGSLVAADSKRYMYVSKPRLEELYGQNTGFLKRVWSRLSSVGVTIGPAKLEMSAQEPSQHRQMDREAQHVKKVLSDAGRLGTFDEPREYFHGTASMFVVPFLEAQPSILYMVGTTESTVVALGGPLRHLINIERRAQKAPRGPG